MKNIFTFCIVLLSLTIRAQCPWSFIITNNSGTYTLNCIYPTVSLSATNNNTNAVNYLWTGPSFTSAATSISVSLPGNYSLVATDAVTSCSLQQTFSLSQNTVAPTATVTPNQFVISCIPSTPIFTGTCSNPLFNIQHAWYSPLNPLPGGVPIEVTNNTLTILTGVVPPGIYTLVTTDLVNGCSTQNTVEVLQANVYFTHTVAPGGAVNFQSAGTGTNLATTYAWNFGDGTIGTGSVTSHTYTNGGVHQVTLSANNPSCSFSNSVNVNTIPCLANSNFTLIYSGTPQTWLAYPAYYGNVTNATWNWGDGASTNSLFPTHTYSAAGLYNICLSVTVSCAGISSTCSGYNIYKTIDVNQAMVTVSVVSAPPVGLKRIEAETISFDIYPNPNNGTFYVQNPSQKKGTIKILNIEGREIQNLVLEGGASNPSAGSNTVTEIKNLNAGIYFVEIRLENSVYRSKIVVTD